VLGFSLSKVLSASPFGKVLSASPFGKVLSASPFTGTLGFSFTQVGGGGGVLAGPPDAKERYDLKVP